MSDITSAADYDEVEYYGEKGMRWYQVAARNAAIQHISEGAMRVLIVLPTGLGKTVAIAATMTSPELRKALKIEGDRPLRVLFVAHKHRLLTQAEQTFADANGIVLMPQSMMSKISDEYIKIGWDIAILDEAHHEFTGSFQYHLEKIGEFPLIGLTATPDRSNGELIKFDHIINPISREDAVKQGFLTETVINSFVDVPSKDKVDVMSDIFTEYGYQFGQTMVFVSTKKEVRAITTVLQNLGYAAIALLDQSDKETNKLLDDFSDGKIQFIVNCNKLSEGVDVKGCTHVFIGRQVGSYQLLNQIIGRSSRISSGDDCYVYELINPLSKNNMDTTIVVGTPKLHKLISKEGGRWVEREFNYINHRSSAQTGIVNRIQH